MQQQPANVVDELPEGGVRIDRDAFYTQRFVQDLFGYTAETMKTYRRRGPRFPHSRVGHRFLYPGWGLLAALERGARHRPT
jgi:hypothetical protein